MKLQANVKHKDEQRTNNAIKYVILKILYITFNISDKMEGLQ